MKGIVFTEFLEMVEEKFSFETMDAIIESADLPSGGIYTAVGTYDHQEIVALVVELHKKTRIPISDLLRTYGEYLFSRFVVLYPRFFIGVNDAFDFLESIHNYIHVEVVKLYPDAQLPTFQTERKGEHCLLMRYSSERSMGDFAHGLILGCLKHFDQKAEVTKEDLDQRATQSLFTITLN